MAFQAFLIIFRVSRRSGRLILGQQRNTVGDDQQGND
jgi:hypothetical protein